jgi:hypothetical protein
LFNDRWEVRFEAVRRSFDYQTVSDFFFGGEHEHDVGSTHGHLWEFPVLATYHFGVPAPVRPYVGGGMSPGITGSHRTGFQTTTTVQIPGQPVTTTMSQSSVTQSLSPLNGAIGYVIGGVEFRTTYLSIRPEFRYSHFPNGSNSDTVAIFQPNQFELLVGFSVHPYRMK